MHPHVPELTLEEKAGLVSGASFWQTRAVERLGIPSITMTDGPHGIRYQSETADHVGINESAPATSFPTASATGSSWNPALIAEMGRALGREARALGVDILLGPGVNIKRSPLCGRNFEYFSEDPLLSGVLGAAWVHGLQSQGVGASLKHYAANNQETDRMRVSADVDERALREIYLPAFEHVVRTEQPATVMCSYNRINGVYASQNPWLLTSVLRDEWGFDGYVVSDWGAVTDPVAAVAAGLDLEMPSTGDRSPAQVAAAVRDGSLASELVDRAVSRLLSTHESLLRDRAEAPLDLDAHHALARRIAAESSVLLRNENATLPLGAAEGGRIAVIGEFARTPRYQGAGSSHINPTRLDDALTAVRAGTGREVGFAPGFTLEGAADEALADEAVALAADAEVVLLFLGLPSEEESEGFDRTHLDLPGVQRELLARVAAANPNVVVILSNGGALALGEIAAQVPALLETWLPGQAGGSAVADVVFGRSEPSGRLAETLPWALSHTPAHVNWPGSDGHVRYGEGVYVGYRWYDRTDRRVAFPFGFGLGYTSFAYSDLRIEVPDAAVARATVSMTLTNTGSRAGSDVVQLYVGDLSASVDRPVRELKAFEKVFLEAGESREIRFDLDERAFAFWGASGWTVEPGAFRIEVGRHVEDLPLVGEIVLEVPQPVAALNEGSTLEEWLGHPVGKPIITGALAQMGEAVGVMASDEMIKMIGSMPLRTLMSFGAAEDADATIARLLHEVEDAPVAS